MKIPRPPKGFTLIELLVVISIIAVLASLAVPAVTGALVRGQLIQAVNNCRQIHLAAMSMATDGAANSDANLGWPGDLATNSGSSQISTQTAYVKQLVNYDYLKGGDLKVFSAAGIVAFTGTDASTFDASKNSAFNMYKVMDTSDSTSLFLCTRNYDASSKAIVSGTTKPFGDKGFVVCRKAGDASVYKKQQASNSNNAIFSDPNPDKLGD